VREINRVIKDGIEATKLHPCSLSVHDFSVDDLITGVGGLHVSYMNIQFIGHANGSTDLAPIRGITRLLPERKDRQGLNMIQIAQILHSR
jgi:hypothetical protein